MGYPNLKAEMARFNITTQNIAELLNVNEKTARDKINGRGSDFKISEGKLIKNRFFLNMELDYLFEDDLTNGQANIEFA